MQHNKTIFVTGATGRQGKAAVESLRRNGFAVSALTRNADSPAAQSLKAMGARLVTGNLDDSSSFSAEVKGAYGIFCVLTYENGINREIKQGKELIDLAVKYNIGHFVYSSVIGSDINTGVPHWESKGAIEQYLQASGVPFTIIRPASLLENFLLPQVKGRVLKGKLPSPVNKHVLQQFIACKDIGDIVANIFADPHKYRGITMNIASDEMDMEEMASLFSGVMQKPVKFQKMPGIITRLVMGSNLYKMFRWINENDAVFVKDLPAFQQEHPGLMSCRDWIKANFSPAV